MTCILALLLFAPDQLPVVSLGDKLRFPGKSTAEQQEDYCWGWERHYALLERYHPGNSDLHRWRQELRQLADYWGLLAQCQTDWQVGPDWNLTLLARLREYIGPYRYGKGWHPELLPPPPKGPKQRILIPPA